MTKVKNIIHTRLQAMLFRGNVFERHTRFMVQFFRGCVSNCTTYHIYVISNSCPTPYGGHWPADCIWKEGADQGKNSFKEGDTGGMWGIQVCFLALIRCIMHSSTSASQAMPDLL